jgi:hypothetical protein
MFRVKIAVFLLPLSLAAQSITGKVYDNESSAKGIQILNITQNLKTYSNENGDFTIMAKIKDSLKFVSLFHHEKFITINKEDFEHIVVIELSKQVNALGEVLLSDSAKPKGFNPIDYTQETTLGIAEDIKMNAHLYKPTPASGFDIKALALEIFKLFKSKKPKEIPIKSISYKAFDSLFSHDKFFNKKLLKEDLHVKDDFKYLFFEYCNAQGLDSKLLEKENHFILLDSLMYYSKGFKTLIKTSHKE